MPEQITASPRKSFRLRVWGPFACFTRPELKAERFSYPVITPSAARGIFDAIYCKPVEFRWQIERIEVLTLPSYIALRRNEVKEKVNVNAVQRWMTGDRDPEPIWADGDKALSGSDEKGRTQRQTMALQNVKYLLTAYMVRWPGCPHTQSSIEEQFARRVRGGKCFQQPYFGCREFSAYFEFEPNETKTPPVPYSADLGLILYDIFDLSRPQSSVAKPVVSLFRARVQDGVLEVPPFGDPAVLTGIASEGL